MSATTIHSAKSNERPRTGHLVNEEKTVKTVGIPINKTAAITGITTRRVRS